MTRPYLVVSCANADDVLRQNLLASPDIVSGTLPVRLIRGATSAAAAYASAIDERPAEIIVFVHQDVYLPANFKAQLDALVDRLDRTAPSWGVAGVYGATTSGSHAGYIYDGSNGRVLGHPVGDPVEVAVLDEVLLIVRLASGVNFDPALPSFHLYGTQIAMDARAKGCGVFVGDIQIVHNSRSILSLGKDYEAAWLYLAKAWVRSLPVPNLCCGMTTKSRWPLWRWRLRNEIRMKLRRRQTFERATDGRTLALLAGFE